MIRLEFEGRAEGLLLVGASTLAHFVVSVSYIHWFLCFAFNCWRGLKALEGRGELFLLLRLNSFGNLGLWVLFVRFSLLDSVRDLSVGLGNL